jgi:hypothetical protein
MQNVTKTTTQMICIKYNGGRLDCQIEKSSLTDRPGKIKFIPVEIPSKQEALNG